MTALPRITNYPSSTITLPVSGQKVRCRSFTVKEEKKLLLLKESTPGTHEVLEAMSDIVNECTYHKVDATKLASVDLEYMFLQVRCISKGNTSELGYKCEKPGEGGTPCGAVTVVKVDLSTISLKEQEPWQKSYFVPESEPKIGLHFRLPTLELAALLEEQKKKVNRDLSTGEEFDIFIGHCLESVTVGEEMITDFGLEDLQGFLDSVPSAVFEEIRTNFIERQPQLATNVEFNCAKCGHHTTLHLEGAQDFF